MSKLVFEEQASPSTPATNKVALYAKAGGGIFKMDDAGSETELAASGTSVDISGTPVTNDIARFTDVDTIEGRSYTELKSDLGIDYQTIYIDAAAMLACTTSGAKSGTNEYATAYPEMDYFGFDTAADERVQFKLVMPENWDRSTIKALFFWSDSGAGTGTVAWAIKAVALSNDDPLATTAFGTAVVATADTLIASNDMHITAVTGAITVGGSPAINEIIAFEIYRDVSADTLDEDARLFGCEIQYKVTNAVAAW